MTEFARYAIYYAPDPGPLAQAAAAWLGWDPELGQPVTHPDLPGLPRPLATLTDEPRKYGFHATLKAPFRLADGTTRDDLERACAGLARSQPVVVLKGLRVVSIDRFLALVPETESPALQSLAAACVEALEALRAPLTPAEIARRAPDRLSDRQRDLLTNYGYPYVFEEFRFHMTLTRRLENGEAAAVIPIAQAYFAGHLPRPFPLTAICLFGQSTEGQFHLLHRYPLSR